MPQNANLEEENHEAVQRQVGTVLWLVVEHSKGVQLGLGPDVHFEFPTPLLYTAEQVEAF